MKTITKITTYHKGAVSGSFPSASKLMRSYLRWLWDRADVEYVDGTTSTDVPPHEVFRLCAESLTVELMATEGMLKEIGRLEASIRELRAQCALKIVDAPADPAPSNVVDECTAAIERTCSRRSRPPPATRWSTPDPGSARPCSRSSTPPCSPRRRPGP